MPSDVLIEHGIYPNKGHLPKCAGDLCQHFQMGLASAAENGATVADWFQIYDDKYADADVWCEYLPVTSMNTLLVLLTIDEDDLMQEEYEEQT